MQMICFDGGICHPSSDIFPWPVKFAFDTSPALAREVFLACEVCLGL
jgi:hypothetical protein